MSNHYKKAFTLIELLVVLAIIGLLTMVAVVSLRGSRDKAKIASGQKFDGDIIRTVGVNLVGEWLFNEGSGAVARDSSGNGFNGTITSPAWVSGMEGSAFSGAVGRYVSLGTNQSLNPANMTITAWVKPGDFSGLFHPIYSNSRDCCDVYKGISFYLRYNKLRATAWNNSPYYIVSNGNISNDPVWTFVAFSYDGASMKLYINGHLDATVAQTNAIGQPAALGAFIGAAGYFPTGFSLTGAVDRVRLYDSGLIASEIKNIYLAQKDNYLAQK